jgi:chemotaxis protein CheX
MEKIVRPFIDTCKNVFQELFGAAISESRPYLIESGAIADGDISAIIGLTGDTRGAVVITMKKDLAIKITGMLTGTEHKDLDDDVIDAVGEILSIITGNVKKSLEDDLHLILSLPTVVQGQNHVIRWPGIRRQYMRFPFKIFLNSTFSLSVAIESVDKKDAT